MLQLIFSIGVKEKTEADQAELRKHIAAIVLSNLRAFLFIPKHPLS